MGERMNAKSNGSNGTSGVDSIVAQAQALFEDTNFTAARQWKEAEPGRRVIGYMPIYVPREIIHAAGALPLGIVGGGDQMDVIHGDAYYQSYICRIPRSTIELGLSGRLDFVDGMLFPSICDVIRNLSGMWKLMFPHVYTRYFDVPQNYVDDIGGNYYVNELAELRHGLEELAGRPITDEDLRPRSQPTTRTAAWLATSTGCARRRRGRRPPRKSIWCCAPAWCCRSRTIRACSATISPRQARSTGRCATTAGWCSPGCSASSRRSISSSPWNWPAATWSMTICCW
jgi:hypothetical protein